MLTLVTGGARSGKSGFAEAYCSRLSDQGVYVATAQALDAEMQARIEHHRQQRDSRQFAWKTLEEPLELAGLIEGLRNKMHLGPDSADQTDRHRARPVGVAAAGQERTANRQPPVGGGDKHPVILVDCLTLWLSNWLLQYEQDPDIEERVSEKLDQLAVGCSKFAGDSAKHLVLVTNEVGYGLVPEYKLGRHFRDLSGVMNQRFAHAADHVFLVTAGIPMELKSRRYDF
ncbi:bifunctional adenosylcobinamide kinase/adenosylcobinamide-phosphate guanylyltransferase [Paenibacillus xerothermodurans]|uniref:Adenosylcobinamide kinase n=1 Tax=Paenibacillus xerothermodurans TaxID=1977292 RepID=A0A2W1NRK8_PAEXE|nr:bifunctional adenosylcobinamide kinase/adenosylcobinamide-phosphate guanylyltransferase [Paenibacillus xerothermodurans]PZE20376.1 bifunctional adenosylcobinamide kinase/adenosylcobinamide-phosphate guanylyltransferase [Paenibacillus xerothermodurans]